MTRYPGCPRLWWSFGFGLFTLIATPLTLAAEDAQLELWFEGESAASGLGPMVKSVG